MTTDRWRASLICLGAALLLSVPILAGCASNKGPAEAAIKTAEEAVSATVAEASKYVPDQAKSLQTALAAVKGKVAKGEYTVVLNDARSLTDKTKEVASAASAKKAELAKAWEDLSAGMPKVLDAIKGRVDILSKSKKLPANLTAEKFASAKSGLDEMTQQWTAATGSASSGNLMDAITKGTAVKTRAAEVLTTLGMPVPDALKSRRTARSPAPPGAPRPCGAAAPPRSLAVPSPTDPARAR